MATMPSSGWRVAVDVEPDVARVMPRGTATFHCDVIDYHEPIHEYTWDITPPISDSRVTYDNNQKTIHISNLDTSENNTVVTCHVIPESGGLVVSMNGIIEMVEEFDRDGDGGGEDDDGDREEGWPRRPRPKATTKRPHLTTIPANDVLTQRAPTGKTRLPKVTSSSPSDIHTGEKINPRVTKAGGRSQDDSNLSDRFNPATIGVLVGIGALILLAIIFIIYQRRNKHRKRQKSQTFRRALQDAYEASPMPPMAPTIDSRHSQDTFLAVHGRFYNPKYQRPVHKDHKSVPSVAYSRDSGCVDEYVYMEPGERGQSLGSLSVPFGDGYDHLARSTEELDQICHPIAPTNSKKYAQLTPTTSPTFSDYENQEITGMHTFELDEQKRLRYADIKHQGQTEEHPLRRKTSYAKIRGIIKIFRTQNSTRVNIEPH